MIPGAFAGGTHHRSQEPIPGSRHGLPDCKDIVPLTTYVLISTFKVIYQLLRRPDGTLNRNLAEFLDRKRTADATPVDGVASVDVDIERATHLWGRLFWVVVDDPPPSHGGANDHVNVETGERAVQHQGQTTPVLRPLIIFFHGGSFVHSSANTAIYDTMCRRFAKTCNAVVLSLNFRRAPEHRYPAAYEDGLTCLRWTRSAMGRRCLLSLGCCPNRCILAGDSSGGNIAHNVAVRAAGEGIHLTGMVLLMPMFGGQQRTPAEILLDGRYFVTIRDRDWYWRAFLPVGADREHPACNPFSPLAPQLAEVNLPPCLVVVGGLDLLQDWQLHYVHSMQQAGKHVQVMFLENATMGFFLLPNSDLFYSLEEKLRGFISQL
uniref:Gibberellin receptor GID1L2 n=1 Tax=Lygodium japonicum TaxID=13824 RepID=A0A0B6VLA1_LYGJA|nr:gibberellin receptor GID1L2 [Lygodium japonicum]